MNDIMTYAIVWTALALGTGISVGPFWMPSAQPVWIAATCFLAVAIVGCRWPRWVRVTGMLAAVVALGILRNSGDSEFPDWLIRRTPSLREVVGVVASYPDIGQASISFTLTPANLPGDLVVYASCDRPLDAVHYGETVCVRGSARLPTAFDGFDYPAYLKRRNVFATLFADEIVLVEGASPSLGHWGDGLRQRLLQRFRDILQPNVAAMAQSLLLGDRSALAQDTEEAFSQTGLMHLLAVSGLHLGIFLAGAWWGLRRLGVRPRIAYPLVGLLVLLAVVVVGPRVSLIRAGLLYAFLALGSVLADCGLILRRWIHPLNGLGAAAIVILLIRPGALFDSGFQLTMAATASILLSFSPLGWAARCSRALQTAKLWRGWVWAMRLILVSAAAQAGAAPVIAWHFHAFHPLGILVNLVAVPLAGLSLWAGLLSLGVSSTFAFSVAVVPFVWLLKGLEGMVQWLASWPLIEQSVSPDFGIWLAGCVGFLFLADFYVSSLSRMSNSMSMAPGSTGD